MPNNHKKALDKKARILAAAEEVVSEKGLNDTTISDISKKAGVADSIIYQFFKGKEDLVFSIPESKYKELFSQLDEHLQGILDVRSRLSKIMWFHLRYCDMHPQYARILYFECLSNKDFYSHPGYEVIRKYARILLSSIQEGMATNCFRSDVEPRFIRDILMGFLGCELIGWLAVGDVDSCVPDLPDIMNLVWGMLAPDTRPEQENKADRILRAAESVFAENGFHKTKVSDIAKLAGVGEGTVYEYFGTKEDLLLAIPERHFNTYSHGLHEIFNIQDPLKKLRRYIKYYFSLFSTKRDFLRVFLIQIQLSRGFYGSKAFKAFEQFFKFADPIIEEGKAQGVFREDANARLFRYLFIGTFNNLTLRWFVLNSDEKVDKMQAIDQITDLLCSAVTVDGEMRRRGQATE